MFEKTEPNRTGSNRIELESNLTFLCIKSRRLAISFQERVEQTEAFYLWPFI
jgi:hypothetical protein